MGFKIDYREDNEDTLEAYLSGIVKDSEITADDMLDEAAETVKEYVVANLNKHRRSLAVRYKGRPAMADDVKINKSNLRSGNKSAKVQGGRKTGTLWHLVNDGNLHSSPTHFMDGALARLDGDIDKLWDKVIK